MHSVPIQPSAAGALHWYVVRTKHQREALAADHLARRGVTSFLPRVSEPGRTGTAVVPLFPGYLFLQLELERQFFDVIWTPGVYKFVGFGPAPSTVGDEVIEFLQDRTGPNGVLRMRRELCPGEVVRITRGPFEGLLAIIESPGSAQGRVRVLMELLRRQTRVELPENILERTSA